jgi:D-alanyl-D-alanine dipeptidase/carboxypeptidase
MKKLSLPQRLIYSGDLILVNQQYPFIKGAGRLCRAAEGMAKKSILLQSQFASAFTRIMNEISAWGEIVAVSGWRSRFEQEQIYEESVRLNGADFTAKYVAVPGHSEHQTGLALDLGLNQQSIDFLRPHFSYSGICGEFRSRAALYGLIERYPKGKETITGISYEPWHFRYVGRPHSRIMNETGDTLEEYHMRLKNFHRKGNPFRYEHDGETMEVFYIAADRESVDFEIADVSRYSVSGNNMDGFVITRWRA